MSRAFKCDRCGGFYEPQSNSLKQINICDERLSQMDICPLCQAKFEAWFEAGKIEEEENGTKG